MSEGWMLGEFGGSWTSGNGGGEGRRGEIAGEREAVPSAVAMLLLSFALPIEFNEIPCHRQVLVLTNAHRYNGKSFNTCKTSSTSWHPKSTSCPFASTLI